MFERLSVMLMKEFLQLRRDRWAMVRLIAPLVIQLFIFGYAATFTVHHVATAVLDLDNSQASRSLISHLAASSRFDIVARAKTRAAITRDINNGSAAIAVVIDAGFAAHLATGQGAPVQVIVDGTNSNTALIALGYLNQITARFSAQRAGQAFPAYRSVTPRQTGVTLIERPWFNEGLDERWFFIPGVIGTLTLIQVVSLTAFAIVREREVGTLEQIMVSPIRPMEFILGKTVPFFLIGLGDVALITTLGIAWFEVPLTGSVWVLLSGTSLFLLAALGMGLLLSTFSTTQQQAFALNFFLVNPFFILSGFAFPIAAMPQTLQWFTFINPLRYFLIVLRAVFLKGVGWGVLWPDFLAMTMLAAVMLAGSIFRFRKSLD